MNREIKFRGKTKTGQWVFGYLHKDSEGTYILTEEDVYDVIPETVGQFTGLHDKNETEVYEGDIIDFTYQCLKEQFTGIVGLNGYNHSCIIVPNIPSDYGSNEFHIENITNGEVIGSGIIIPN